MSAWACANVTCGLSRPNTVKNVRLRGGCVRVVELQRRPDLRVGDLKRLRRQPQPEARRHDADHGLIETVQPDPTTHDAGIAAVPAPPQIVAEDHDLRTTDRFFFRGEVTSVGRIHTEQREEVRGDRRDFDAFRLDAVSRSARRWLRPPARRSRRQEARRTGCAAGSPGSHLATSRAGIARRPRNRSRCSRSARAMRYGRGRSRTPFTTVKIVVAAPMPRPSVMMAIVAKPGLRISVRSAYRTSCPTVDMPRL